MGINPVRFSSNWSYQPVPYCDVQEPQTQWMYWIGDESAENETVEITVQDSGGTTVTTLTDEGSYDFNTVD